MRFLPRKAVSTDPQGYKVPPFPTMEAHYRVRAVAFDEFGVKASGERHSASGYIVLVDFLRADGSSGGWDVSETLFPSLGDADALARAYAAEHNIDYLPPLDERAESTD